MLLSTPYATLASRLNNGMGMLGDRTNSEWGTWSPEVQLQYALNKMEETAHGLCPARLSDATALAALNYIISQPYAAWASLAAKVGASSACGQDVCAPRLRVCTRVHVCACVCVLAAARMRAVIPSAWSIAGSHSSLSE